MQLLCPNFFMRNIEELLDLWTDAANGSTDIGNRQKVYTIAYATLT